MFGRAVLLVTLTVSLADGCGGNRPASDKGGDGNPNTGACEITYEETVGGRFHRYPELADGGQFVFGKVIVTCEKPPKTHHIDFYLEVRKPGAGQAWKQVKYNSSDHIPNPKETVSQQGNCDAVGKEASWRVRVRIVGAGVTEGPQNAKFDVEDFSPERLITCPS